MSSCTSVWSTPIRQTANIEAESLAAGSAPSFSLSDYLFLFYHYWLKKKFLIQTMLPSLHEGCAESQAMLWPMRDWVADSCAICIWKKLRGQYTECRRQSEANLQYSHTHTKWSKCSIFIVCLHPSMASVKWKKCMNIKI